MGVQPQRIPLGTVTVGGKSHPVFITIEWLKVLGTTSSSGGGSSGGGSSGGSSGTATEAIELGYDEAIAAKVLAIGLQRALSALEADATLHALRAQVAALSDRVVALEQAP